MTHPASFKNVRSKRDARYLVNSVMGILSRQDNPDADTIIDVVTCIVRGYTKGYYKRSSHAKEEGVYRELKEYAWERIYRKEPDAALMKEFVNMTRWAEENIRTYGNDDEHAEKMFSTFPMDCLREDELQSFTEDAWERFRAKFYQSDGTPGIGMLVFKDAEGITAFTRYMLDNHSDLVYENRESDASE